MEQDVDGRISDDELRTLGVPDAKLIQFRKHLKNAIRNFLRPHRGGRVPRSTDVTSHLDKLIENLEALKATFAALKSESGPGAAAGALFLVAHSRRPQTGTKHNPSIEELIESQNELIRAAEAAKKSARIHFPHKGRPEGQRIAAPGFNMLLCELMVAARICKFTLTAYPDRSAPPCERRRGKEYEDWNARLAKGTLITLLDRLEPHLPSNSFPVSRKMRLKLIEAMRKRAGLGRKHRRSK